MSGAETVNEGFEACTNLGNLLDADLPGLLERIQSGEKPGFISGLFSRLTGKSAEDAVREFMEEVGAKVADGQITISVPPRLRPRTYFKHAIQSFYAE